MADAAPLEGVLVVDVTRMLPGAVLARTLLDLGARLIKVEDPSNGDAMRGSPPLVGGVGAAFASYFRGAESLLLNLRSPRGAAALRNLARHADVLCESFRPGTLDRWGAGPRALTAANPRLVICSLTGYGASGEHAGRPGHDLNFVAESGLSSRFPEGPLPTVPFADVAAGILAASAVLAALLSRAATGRGRVLDQPLAAAPLPFVAWPAAEAAAGGGPGFGERLLSGRFPCYRLYACADGAPIAVGALEPKFWEGLLAMLDLPELAPAALDPGAAGEAAARRIAERLAGKPRAHWLAEALERDLPLSPVASLAEAAGDPASAVAPFFEATPIPGGGTLRTPGPVLPSLGRTPSRPAPALGQHTEALDREFGLGLTGGEGR